MKREEQVEQAEQAGREVVDTYDRRDLIKSMAVSLSVPALAQLSAGELVALGHRVHGAMPAQSSPSLTVLTQHQGATVDRISELILPETDTAGASAAKVYLFIDRMLDGWFPESAKQRYLEGLAGVDRNSDSRYGKRFVELEPEQQTAQLEALEAEAADVSGPRSFSIGNAQRLDAAHFWTVTKWLTLYGYFTSEVGMKQELGYRIVPGRWDPCVDL